MGRKKIIKKPKEPTKIKIEQYKSKDKPLIVSFSF